MRSELEAAGLDTRIVSRNEFSRDLVSSVDAVVTTGGDGTFLLAAAAVGSAETPVIGFNSDPIRSSGHLCLPKKYSVNVKEAVHKLTRGRFR